MKSVYQQPQINICFISPSLLAGSKGQQIITTTVHQIGEQYSSFAGD